MSFLKNKDLKSTFIKGHPSSYQHLYFLELALPRERPQNLAKLYNEPMT